MLCADAQAPRVRHGAASRVDHGIIRASIADCWPRVDNRIAGGGETRRDALENRARRVGARRSPWPRTSKAKSSGRPPAVVLVEPQMGENIGAAARAMANFGLTDLRLVRPRDGWPSKKARAAASGATGIVDDVRVFDSAEEAIADLNFVFATTRTHARPAEGGHRPARGGKRAAEPRGRRRGLRPALRARALGSDQRGDRARRRDRHLSRQPEIRLAQHRAGGAARRATNGSRLASTARCRRATLCRRSR